jgi:DNA-binding transcriptional ArsR family regulator
MTERFGQLYLIGEHLVEVVSGLRDTLYREPNVSAVASLIADPARAAMLSALLDGRALPAGELAYASGVTAQTASSHLSLVVACLPWKPRDDIVTTGWLVLMSRRRSNASRRSRRLSPSEEKLWACSS